MIVTNKNFSTFAKNISTNNDPTLHSPAAMERYMRHMDKYITHVRVPHGKYKSINNCKLIQFKTDKQRHRYQEAYQRYLENVAKIRGESGGGGNMEILVEFLKFAQAAELIRAEELAALAYNEVNTQGKAAVIACRFRGTIARVVRILVRDYKVERKKISLIWGGDDSLDKSKRLTGEQIRDLIKRISRGDESIKRKQLKQLEKQLLENQEDREEANHDYGEDLQLGSQDKSARQKEIDRFQSGKSLYCLFTFAAGGAGLSLHHAERDPYGNPIVLRPRRAFLTPVYSAQDFVQGLGRAHRSVFSMSDTEQTILFYDDTIEVHVMKTVSIKLKCLGKVVQSRENWMDAVYEGSASNEHAKELIRKEEARLATDADKEAVELFETDSNEEEED